MKIIKPGKIKKEVFEGTCRHCGAEVEADRIEITASYDPREDATVGAALCPECSLPMNFHAVFK